MTPDLLFSRDLTPWLAAMTPWFVKGLVLLAATALLVYALRQSTAALRHLIWCTALVSLLVLPALSLVLPVWRVTVPDLTAPASTPVPSAEPTGILPVSEADVTPLPPVPHRAASASTPLPPAQDTPVRALWTVSYLRTLLAWIWVAGGVGLLGWLLLMHMGVRLMLYRARRVDEDDWNELAEEAGRRLGLTRPVRLRWSADTTVPLCVGVWRPYVVLPEEAAAWPAARREAVLLHELAHVRRRDGLTHLLVQVACAVHWFNPLAWVGARRLAAEREHACDAMVLTAGVKPSDYAEALLAAARSVCAARWTTRAAFAMARRSQFEGRLLAILDAARPAPLSRGSRWLALALMAALVLPLAAFTRAEEPNSHAMPVPAISAFAPEAVAALSAPAARVEPQPAPAPAPDPALLSTPDPAPSAAPAAAAEPDTLSIDDLIRLRRYGVDGAFIRGLRSLGLDDLTTDELIDLAKYGADPEYVAAMHAVGFTNTRPDELAEMAKYGLDAGFVRAVREAGYREATTDELIALAKYGADVRFMAAMREAGLQGIDLEGLADLAKYGVDADFIAAMRRIGYTELSADELIALAKYGVDPAFVETMNGLGYANLSTDDLVDLAKYGVDADIVARLAEHGYTGLATDDLVDAAKYGVDPDLFDALDRAGLKGVPLEKVIQMAKYGVDAAYLDDLREAGLTTFTADRLIEMRKHGVDADFIRSMQ